MLKKSPKKHVFKRNTNKAAKIRKTTSAKIRLSRISNILSYENNIQTILKLKNGINVIEAGAGYAYAKF